MKRSASSTPPLSPLVTPKSEHHDQLDEDYTPASGTNHTPTPTKKARAGNGASPKTFTTTAKSIKKATNATPYSPSVAKADWEPGWSPDKKEAIVERLMSIGIKSANIADLCREFNLTKTQLGNATQVGHKGNLREKAAKGVRG